MYRDINKSAAASHFENAPCLIAQAALDHHYKMSWRDTAFPPLPACEAGTDGASAQTIRPRINFADQSSLYIGYRRRIGRCLHFRRSILATPRPLKRNSTLFFPDCLHPDECSPEKLWNVPTSLPLADDPQVGKAADTATSAVKSRGTTSTFSRLTTIQVIE